MDQSVKRNEKLLKKTDDDSQVSYSDNSFDDDDISSSVSLEEELIPSDSLLSSGQDEITFDAGKINPTGAAASSLMSLFPLQNEEKGITAVSNMDSTEISFSGTRKQLRVSPSHHRQSTQRISNLKNFGNYCFSSDEEDCHENSHLLAKNRGNIQTSSAVIQTYGTKEARKQNVSGVAHRSFTPKCKKMNASILSSIAGSAVFALFHIVFCLAQASAIHRPYSSKSVLGVMVRVAAVGPLVAGVMFIYALDGDFATVAPTIDVFPAPFFAEMAAIVDECLVQAGLEDDDFMFLTTFGILTGIALLLTGMLLIMGTKIKLANLSAFLPYPVMCGFFSSVGVLLWNLAFTIDTGENIKDVLFGGDTEKMKYCIIHHAGSLFAGAFTFLVTKKKRDLVPLLAVMPIPLVYLGMALTQTSLEDAQKHGWFWSQNDLSVRVSWSNVDAIKWEPPLPFGVIVGIIRGKAYVPAIVKGFPIALSMALIFFIRCSLHAPALRKTSNNLLKWKDEQAKSNESQRDINSGESEDQELWLTADSSDLENLDQTTSGDGNLPVAEVFMIYGKILSLNGFAGGFACLPSIGAGGTLYKIGAAAGPSQYGSLVLLAIFYLTQFDIVGFLPKMTFSALLFVTSMEMTESWFVASFKKTAVKTEWIVIPIIVFATFLVGSLQSVALGLAISTFIFVGTLNRSGVVKFISNGLTVKSVTERNAEDAAWLDQNGDLIQLLVLQSYIFFGNANSCLSYVNSMFEDPPESVTKTLKFPLPPLPKYLIIDMSLVVGMDTSSVDVFGEIITFCHRKHCKVFLTGLTPRWKEILSLGGIKPSNDNKSANSILRFPSDIESALCTAEDGLLKSLSQLEQKEMIISTMRRNSCCNDGFQYALSKIDEQHDLGVTKSLAALEPHTKVIELMAGQSLLYDFDGTLNENRKLGLYFIEHGMMKVERDQSLTTTRGSLRRRTNGSESMYANPRINLSLVSLADLNCRTPTIGRESYLLKNIGGREKRSVRLARLKPGFVIGMVGDSQIDIIGDHIATTVCRLHHLGQSKINELEKKDPRLILELFKMMSYLSAQRQETTIDQLATLHQILSSLAPTKPVDRITMAAMKKLASTMDS